MLCPRCGKETEQGLCEKCFFEINPIKLRKIEISMCSCGKYKSGKSWKNNLENSLNTIVKNNLIVPDGVLVKDIKVLPKFDKRKIILEIKIKALYARKEILQTFNDEIKINHGTCETCGSLRSFTAILQFRGFEPEISVRPEFLTKVERMRHGLDFYLTKKEYARKIAKKFKKKGFAVRESQTLFGIDDSGKRRSRLTISVRK